MANDGPVSYEQAQGSTETADLSRGYGSFTCTPPRSILPRGKEWDGTLSAQSDKYPDDIFDSVGCTTLTEENASPSISHGSETDILRLLSSLPPGFRFQPTDEELVGFYLANKLRGSSMPMQLIPDVELYRYDPWELPSLSPSSKYLHSSVDTFAVRQWFFFTSCDHKYSHGCRANRSTRSGYWKATGRDRLVLRTFPTSTSIPTLPSSHSHAFEIGHSTQPHAQLTSCTDVSVNGDAGNEHGFKKTLVFYHGKPPRGTRTPWVMHEFYISSCPSSSSASTSSPPLLSTKPFSSSASASSPPLLSTKPFSSSASASSPPLLSKKPTAWNKILLCRITRKMDQTAGRAEHTNERCT